MAQQAGSRRVTGGGGDGGMGGSDAGPSVASLPGASAAAQQAAMIETEAGRMMEIARVNGQVQARSIERIGEIVKENPSATATIIRQWIHEAG
jgi:flagellar M-ring protein FliF